MDVYSPKLECKLLMLIHYALGIDERAEILRLRRRFLKDQEKLSLIYARKGVAEQKREKVCLLLNNLVVRIFKD